MQLDWTPAQNSIRKTFWNIGRQAASEPGEFDHSTWKRLLEAGLWHMVVPVEHGGQGRHWWDFTAAIEGLALAVRSPAILLSIIAQAGMVRALDRHGVQEQKRRYFRRILAGELSATAIADPDTGTDVRATSTVLTPDHNDTFVLHGQKYNIAHASIATFVLVVCKLSNHDRDGISLVFVDTDAEGLSIGPCDKKLGLHDLPTGQMRFTGVKLDYSDLLGEAGKGLRNLVDIVSLGRLYYGLTAALIVEPMLADSLAFASSRTTFGTAIAEHQHVQRRLTDVRIRAEAGKWVSYAALGRLLSGSDDAIMLSSVAKLVGANTVVESALDLLRLHGSRGYHEGAVSDFVRDALAYCSVGGTEEMHRKNIMNQMVRSIKRDCRAQDRDAAETDTPLRNAVAVT